MSQVKDKEKEDKELTMEECTSVLSLEIKKLDKERLNDKEG